MVNHDTNPVRAFLQSPLNRVRFDDFLGRCLEVATGYLRYLSARRFSLPLELYSSDNPTRDLAIDILGSLLSRFRGEPFGIVFEYYQREGFEEFDAVSEEELYHHLTILIRSFVRQELSKLRKRNDPQIENLKRRIGDILKDPRYCVLASESSPGRDRVTLAPGREVDDDHREPWPQNELVLAAEWTYQRSPNRSLWCRNLVEEITQDERWCDWVYRHQLVAAMIGVCRANQLLEMDQPSRIPPADHGLSSDLVDQASQVTREWLREDVLQDFVTKGRITVEDIEPFLAAFDAIIADGTQNGTLDKLPAYFRVSMPDQNHQEYLSKYKYVFETAMKGGLQYMAQILTE